MIQISMLTLILALSGLVHFMDPFAYVNAIPLIIPYKLEIIAFTGALEILLGLGLLIKIRRKMILTIIAFYFTLLLPINLHIAVMGIPFHGLKNPYVLWSGFFIQISLIFWVQHLRKA